MRIKTVKLKLKREHLERLMIGSAAALVLLPVGEAARTAMFVISTMPASTSLGLMAGLYDADGPFGAQIVAVSTLLSAVTIPLMTMLLL